MQGVGYPACALSYTLAPAPPKTRENMPSSTSIETLEGRFIDLLQPQSYEVNLNDIAYGLAHECRYTHFCTQFYCVAQHSLLVRDILAQFGADESIQRLGLFHDAHEAYLRDISAPMKRAIRTLCAEMGMDRSPLDVLADRFDAVIFGEFDVRCDEHSASLVHEADMAAYRIERKQLMVSRGKGWQDARGALQWGKLPHMDTLAAQNAWLAAAL